MECSKIESCHGRRAVRAALVLAAVMLLPPQPGHSAAPGPLPPPANVLSNRTPAVVRPTLRTNTVPPAASRSAVTNPAIAKAALPKSVGTNTVSNFADTFKRLQSSPNFLPVVAGAGVCLLLLLAFRIFSSRKRSQAAAEAGTTHAAHSLRAVSARKATVHGCNVLEVGALARQVWHFDVRGQRCVFSREHTVMEGEPLPAMVRKDWRTLFQRKLNVAWLPPEHVFLRAAQLPRGDFSDTLSMVELQLEKFSPIPVTQIVWSIHVLPHAAGDMQTVVVMIVSRAAVEEFLGKLEGQGYLADRLELPLLDQLQTTAITEDGAWIYPEVGGSKSTALVAWWYGGMLRNLDLLTLTAEDHAGSLKEQLMQMAWAGEMEGWLSSPPDWHLVADAMLAAQWEPVLRTALELPVEIVTPLAARDLAALTARRAATADPRASLMPLEYATRYQQQFVDRLWMRGLLAVAGLYAIGVAVYMVALGLANYRTGKVEAKLSQIAPTYTNAMQLKARFQVLKDRQELKYAALDCWNSTAQSLPESATLDSLNFSQGKRLSLNGDAPSDSIRELYDFESAVRKVTSNGQPLFDQSKGETINWRVQGPKASWSLALELKRSEVQ